MPAGEVDRAKFDGGVCAHVRECMPLTNVMQAHGPITDVTTIAERLARARKELGIGQAELARRAGVSPGTIGNIESGARKDPRGLLEIAAAAEVMPEWLKHGKLPKRPPGWSQPMRDIHGTSALSIPPEEGAPGWVPATGGGVAHEVRHPTSEDELKPQTWEFILSGALLPLRFTAAVPDDALAPKSPRGTEFVFSTTFAGQPDDSVVVIVQAGNGRRYMRLFFAGAGDEWEARARDQAFPTLRSVADGLRLVAVATFRPGGQG